jgi:hypothetical protein
VARVVVVGVAHSVRVPQKVSAGQQRVDGRFVVGGGVGSREQVEFVARMEVIEFGKRIEAHLVLNPIHENNLS